MRAGLAPGRQAAMRPYCGATASRRRPLLSHADGRQKRALSVLSVNVRPMSRAKHPSRRQRAQAPGLTSSGRRKSQRAYDPRSIAPPGQGLGDLHPDLLDCALYCPKYPDLPLARVRVGSNVRVHWQCRCGSVTRPLKVITVVSRGAVVCDRCQVTGKSRLEFEVAELLQAMLDLEVYTHYGPSRRDQVDLYVPFIDTAIELDPHWSHRDRLETDVRRMAHHARSYQRVIRVRDEGLPTIAGCPTVSSRASAPEWARTICRFLAMDARQDLKADEIDVALRAAAIKFRSLQQTPPARSLADRPDIACDFIENLTVPNQTPTWISIGSGDLCRWRCPADLHEPYEQTVDKRTGPQQCGCKHCGRLRISSSRRRPAPGQSAADAAPELVSAFVSNLHLPELALTDVRPNSHDQCLWRCSSASCDNLLRESVKGRRARPGAVCGDCRSTRVWDTRRANFEDPVNIHWRLGVEEFAAHTSVTGHGRVPERTVTQSGFKLGVWVRHARRASLTHAQQADLLLLDHWSQAPKEAAWWNGYALLEQYVHREGHARVPAKHTEDGYTLGLYVGKQRKRYNEGVLSAERVRHLESIPQWLWRLRKRRSNAASGPRDATCA